MEKKSEGILEKKKEGILENWYSLCCVSLDLYFGKRKKIWKKLT